VSVPNGIAYRPSVNYADQVIIESRKAERRSLTQQEATTVNDEMVRKMNLRRKESPERRRPLPSHAPVSGERRRICSFCYQPGDHQTAAQCLSALER
jgi:hypothetical protein